MRVRGESGSKAVTIIRPKARNPGAQLGELFQYRSFYGFLLREISMKKFKGTVLGFWWLIIRPLLPATMAVVTFTFIVPIESYGLPYVIFFLSGFITWNLFQATVVFMPRTLMWMRGIMKKTYFPRLLVPLASVGPPSIEFLVVLAVLAIALIGFLLADGVLYLRGDWCMLLLPLCFAASMMLGVAIGMFFSVLALFVRDVIFSVSYFAQISMFLTPVIYPVSVVPESYRWIVYLLNPLAVLVETSRVALTGNGILDPAWLLVSCSTILLIFALSVWFFLRVESVLADAL